MKTPTHAGLLLMLTVGPVVAQAGQREQPVFAEEVRHYARSLRLPALSSGIETGRLEIRIWVGFGITGVDLYQIRRVGDKWSGRRFYPVDVPERLTIDTLGPSLPWVARWTEAEAAGIWALPTSPQRENTKFFVDDGWSVVLEFANGATYHISGADNPQVFCSADDRQIVTVIDILLPTVAWHCRQDP